jgi:hypothetical protein
MVNMNIALAIDLDIPSALTSFDHNRWPGSGWIKELKKLCDAKGVGLALAQDLDAETKDVYLVQEDLSKRGDHLIHAIKSVNFCLESVIYSQKWYKTKKTLGFRTTLEFGDGKLYFPSYAPEDVNLENQDRDKNLCMIISNKHYRGFGITPPISQLHDYRYQVIDWARKNYGMDLYGYGWPEDIAKPVEDKLATLRQYKACIVIENDAKFGYITEKMPHAMISGCTPIYYGCPTYQGFSASPAELERSIVMALSTFKDQKVVSESWIKFSGERHLYTSFASTILKYVIATR